MKHIVASLLAAALLLSPTISRADEFSQIANNPKTYWVPAPANSSDPKDVANDAPQQGAPPQGYTAGPPPGYYNGPGPAPGYYYGPPPGYYGPPVAYYGPGPRPGPYYYGPPAAVGYYGGPHGSRVFIGIPGLFLGFHIH